LRLQREGEILPPVSFVSRGGRGEEKRQRENNRAATVTSDLDSGCQRNAGPEPHNRVDQSEKKKRRSCERLRSGLGEGGERKKKRGKGEKGGGGLERLVFIQAPDREGRGTIPRKERPL